MGARDVAFRIEPFARKRVPTGCDADGSLRAGVASSEF